MIDFVGNELNIGDYVVFATSGGLTLGKIVDFTFEGAKLIWKNKSGEWDALYLRIPTYQTCKIGD